MPPSRSRQSTGRGLIQPEATTSRNQRTTSVPAQRRPRAPRPRKNDTVTLHNIDLVKRFNGPLVIDDVTQVRSEAVLQYIDYQLSTLPLLDENDPKYEDRLDSRLMWELLHLFVSKKDAGVIVTPSEIGRLLISHDKQPQSTRNRQKFYDYLFVDHTKAIQFGREKRLYEECFIASFAILAGSFDLEFRSSYLHRLNKKNTISDVLDTELDVDPYGNGNDEERLMAVLRVNRSYWRIYGAMWVMSLNGNESRRYEDMEWFATILSDLNMDVASDVINVAITMISQYSDRRHTERNEMCKLLRTTMDNEPLCDGKNFRVADIHGTEIVAYALALGSPFKLPYHEPYVRMKIDYVKFLTKHDEISPLDSYKYCNEIAMMMYYNGREYLFSDQERNELMDLAIRMYKKHHNIDVWLTEDGWIQRCRDGVVDLRPYDEEMSDTSSYNSDSEMSVGFGDDWSETSEDRREEARIIAEEDAAEKKNRKAWKSKEFGQCLMCCRDNVIEPVGCTTCKNFVGCSKCAIRWYRTSTKRLENPCGNCPLCRTPWYGSAEVQSMKEIPKVKKAEERMRKKLNIDMKW